MIFFRNLDELLASITDFRDHTSVWRGEDGSYAVGDEFPIEAEEGEVEYREAGAIWEYKPWE